MIVGLVFEETEVEVFANHEEDGGMFLVVFAKKAERFFALTHAGTGAG